MKVVFCEPHKKAVVKELGTELKDLQEAVGGYIEAFYPFEEEVCIVCNDEGKFNGCEPCRGIFNENNELLDIIFGNFFICDCSGENFDSLSPEQIDKYLKLYEFPEEFYRVNGKIEVIKVKK